MANTFLKIQTIAREGLMRLQDNLVFPALCNQDYSGEFGKLGDKIQVRKPVNLTAADFTAGMPVNTQDITESSITVELNKIATVDVSIEALEMALNVDDLNRVFIEPAAAALAEKINGAGIQLYKDIPYHCGTAGSTPAALSVIAAAAKVLNVNKAPTGSRAALWNPDAQASLQVLDAVVNAEKSGSTAALREGAIGRLMGFENYMSQTVAAHATGITAATAVKVAGAVSAGATQLAIDATTLTGKLVKGDLLDIGGKSYVVTEDTAAASSNAIATVKVYPATPAIADNADVTLISGHAANLAFHRDAFGFVTRPLAPASSGVSYTAAANGLSMRVTQCYDQAYKREKLSMDILYNFVTLRPELACRVLG